MSSLEKPVFLPFTGSIFCSCSCSYNILSYSFTFILSFRNNISLNDIYKLLILILGRENKKSSQQIFHFLFTSSSFFLSTGSFSKRKCFFVLLFYLLSHIGSSGYTNTPCVSKKSSGNPWNLVMYS